MTPNVIGLGFQRCGTGWLHEILNDHPEISKPETGLHYFNRNLPCGLHWYSAALSAAYRPGTILVEFCTTYSYPETADQVAAAMMEQVPSCRFVVSLREPVARAYSDFQRGVFRGEIAPGTFRQAIDGHPELLSRSRYADIMECFFAHFPADRFHFIRYEDIGRAPGTVVRDLYSFIGASPEHRPRMLHAVTGSAKSVDTRTSALAPWRRPAIRAALQRVAPLRAVVRWGRRRINLARSARGAVPASEIPYDDAATLQEIAGQFTEQIDRIERWTGLDLTEWRRPRCAGGIDE